MKCLRSVFFIHDDVRGLEYGINVNKAEELKTRYGLLAPLDQIKFKKLVLNHEFAELGVDMFYINEIRTAPFPEVFVSDKLRAKLEKEHATGLDKFIEVNIEVE